MIIWVIIQHLEALLQGPGSQLMPLCSCIRIFFILFFECSQLFTVSSVNSAAWESSMSWISASSKSWSHQSQVLWSNTRMYLIYSIMLVRESLLFIDCFMPNVFRQLYRAVDLSLSRNYFIIAMLSFYDYHHLLTLQKSPFASKILWKVWQM
jgi:hypothetical protein